MLVTVTLIIRLITDGRFRQTPAVGGGLMTIGAFVAASGVMATGNSVTSHTEALKKGAFSSVLLQKTTVTVTWTAS